MDRTERLWLVFVLNAVLLCALVVVGFTAHSLGVLAAAGDYIADASAIALAIVASRLARRAPDGSRSFGYHRAGVLAALANAAAVVVVTTIVVVEAVRRLVSGTGEVHGLPTLVVSVAAFVAMGGAALVLARDHADLNMRAVLIDTAGDALAAAGVAVVSTVILVTGRFYWLDPAVALAIALLVAWNAVALVRAAVRVLMESTPLNVVLDDVSGALCEVPSVVTVHDLHVWSLSADVLALSAHLLLEGQPTVAAAQLVGSDVKARLAAQFAIDHVTLEYETAACAEGDEHACTLTSPSTPAR